MPQLLVPRPEDGVAIENEHKLQQSASRIEQRMWDTVRCWWTSSVVQDRPLLTGCWLLPSGPCRTQAPGRVGIACSAGRRASSCISLGLPGRGGSLQMKKSTGSFIWTNYKKKRKQNQTRCNSSDRLSGWFISATQRGWGMRADKQASGLPDYHLTREFKTLWNSEVGRFLPGSCVAFLGWKNSPTPKAAHLQYNSAIHTTK